MAEPPDRNTTPSREPRRALLQERFGPGHVVLPPLTVGPIDAVDVELPLQVITRAHPGAALAAPAEDRSRSYRIRTTAAASPPTASSSVRTRRGHEPRVPRGQLDRPVPERRPPGPDRLVLQEPPQVVGQVLRRRISAGRLLGHRLQDDRLQLARDRAVDFRGGLRLFIGDPPQQFLAVPASKAGRRVKSS